MPVALAEMEQKSNFGSDYSQRHSMKPRLLYWISPYKLGIQRLDLIPNRPI